MRIKTVCQKCFWEGILSESSIWENIILQDNFLHHFKCKNGHDNLVLIQAFKFEILFESGLCAIRDNYYLEAVLSLTASLERFYELTIKILSISNGLSEKDFKLLYNQISNQSERQLGAFLFIYSYAYKKIPEFLLDNKYKNFRNKVVHKGYLPNEKEVKEYAEAIYKIIKHYYIELLQNYKEFIFNQYTKEVGAQMEANKSIIEKLGVQITTLSPAFVLSLARPLDEFEKQDFESCFEHVKSVLYCD